MSEPVISVEGLSKAYSIYAKPFDVLWEILRGKNRHDVFWALRSNASGSLAQMGQAKVPYSKF
jgi:hypothetical protein